MEDPGGLPSMDLQKRMAYLHKLLTTWMNRENIMLLKKSDNKDLRIAAFHLYEISRIGKAKETESRLQIAKGWGKGIWEVTARRVWSFLFG